MLPKHFNLIDIYRIVHPTTAEYSFKCERYIYQDKPYDEP